MNRNFSKDESGEMKNMRQGGEYYQKKLTEQQGGFDRQEYSRYSDLSRYSRATRGYQATRQRRLSKPLARGLTISIVLIAAFIAWSLMPWQEVVDALRAGARKTPQGHVAYAQAPGSTLGSTLGSTPSSATSSTPEQNQGSTAGSQAIGSSQGTNLSSAPVFTKTVNLSEITDTQYLVLINHEHAVTSRPSNGQMITAWPLVPAIDDSVTLHKTTMRAVESLINDAQKAGIGGLYISSGYRDYHEQARLYKEASNKTTVQKPDHSEHQTGLAADIVALSYTYNSAGESIEEKWLAQNSWRYGLVLRYSEDKRSITQIAGESWHFRYIGQPHAWYSWTYNLCLEEYIQFLKNSGGYSVTLDGITYHVGYVRPENNRINVPSDMSYLVSSDNTGGYIVTAWE